jgi:hypothetical protein
LHLTEENRLAIPGPLKDFGIHARYELKQLAAQFIKTVGDVRARQRAAVVEMFVDAISPEKTKLRAATQAVVELRDLGTVDAAQAGIVWAAPGRKAIDVGAIVNTYPIPNDNADTIRPAIFARPPVIAGPVAMAA